MRSMRFTPRRSKDWFICAMPASRPSAHTFVAANTTPAARASRRRSPVTCSARPYIGEESITIPPPSMNAATTAASGARAAASSPTSNVREVPIPITGNCSPLDGIGRRIRVACAAAPSACPARPAAAAPRMTSRRLIIASPPSDFVAPMLTPLRPGINALDLSPGRGYGKASKQPDRHHAQHRAPTCAAPNTRTFTRVTRTCSTA